MVLLKNTDEREIIIKKFFFPIGLCSLCISLILYQFGPEISMVAFLEGMLIGVGIVVLLVSLYMLSRMRRNESDEIPKMA